MTLSTGTAPDSEFRPVVLAPTYNNARTLGAVLARIDELELPAIVVDDGCTDESPAILSAWAASRTGATVIRHPMNLGKAAGLRTGFAAAEKVGFTHALTIDTDGQHDPEQIPELLVAAEANPTALILGVRSETIEGYPVKSRVGRRLSNMFIRIESGAVVEDSQSGFRVYPLGLVRTIRAAAGRFGYETEILTRAAWAGCPIVQVPIRSRYFSAEERVSHFRPGMDTVRAIGMHGRLIGRELLPLPHRRWPGRDAGKPLPWWNRLGAWLSPRRAWNEIREHPEARATVATGLAVGVFVANAPVPFLHPLIALYVAKRLHLHPIPVLAGAALSTPPLGPLLIAAAIWLGYVIIQGHPPTSDLIHPVGGFSWSWFGTVIWEWLIGSFILGLTMGVATFALAKVLLRRIPGPRAKAGVPEGPTASA